MYIVLVIIRFSGTSMCVFYCSILIRYHTQGVFERLNKIDDISSVGWVCVDQRPAKQALSSLVSKWKHVYASHLERQVHL